LFVCSSPRHAHCFRVFIVLLFAVGKHPCPNYIMTFQPCQSGNPRGNYNGTRYGRVGEFHHDEHGAVVAHPLSRPPIVVGPAAIAVSSPAGSPAPPAWRHPGCRKAAWKIAGRRWPDWRCARPSARASESRFCLKPRRNSKSLDAIEQIRASSSCRVCGDTFRGWARGTGRCRASKLNARRRAMRAIRS
jgi:hypothetical protein